MSSSEAREALPVSSHHCLPDLKGGGRAKRATLDVRGLVLKAHESDGIRSLHYPPILPIPSPNFLTTIFLTKNLAWNMFIMTACGLVCLLSSVKFLLPHASPIQIQHFNTSKEKPS